MRACCVFSQYLGNIRVQRLPEIWNGVQQRELRRRLKDGDLTYGCSYCAWEVERDLAPYARLYDTLDVDSIAPAHPTRIEFALSNACNLQCTMCTGEISSAIRIHREGRMPSPPAYGDQFFTDLEAFLPHLRSASFSGGEPFLGSENFRVWELMGRHGLDLDVDITTNATQWSPRVERVLQTLRPAVQVSMDGTTKATFEGIRQGADFSEVRANVERFLTHARSVGTAVGISHCLVPQNHHEFGDLLVYAEERGMRVHVGVVMTPADHALERLDRAELAAVLRSLEAQAERVAPQLRGHNSRVLAEQVERVRAWTESHGEHEPAGTIDYEQVLGLPRRSPTALAPPRRVAASGPAPAETADGLGAELGRRLDDPHRRLDIGPNDIILDCSPAAAEWLRVERAALIGVHVEHVERALTRRFGPLAPDGVGGPQRGDDAGASGDVVERNFTTTTGGAADGGHVRTVAVAVRDRAGWIERVVLSVGHPAY